MCNISVVVTQNVSQMQHVIAFIVRKSNKTVDKASFEGNVRPTCTKYQPVNRRVDINGAMQIYKTIRESANIREFAVVITCIASLKTGRVGS